MIVNYDCSIINKFGASLTDNDRTVIYDPHMFGVQATGGRKVPRYGVPFSLSSKSQNY
jgi:hypothetical protein